MMNVHKMVKYHLKLVSTRLYPSSNKSIHATLTPFWAEMKQLIMKQYFFHAACFPEFFIAQHTLLCQNHKGNDSNCSVEKCQNWSGC